MIPDHFQPGMPFGPKAELFGNLAFEHVKRLAFGCQRQKGLGRPAAGQHQVIGPQDRHQIDFVLVRVGEELNNFAALAHNLQRLTAKIVKGQVGNAVSGYCLAITDLYEIHVH
jgi:hypothetical protein